MDALATLSGDLERLEKASLAARKTAGEKVEDAVSVLEINVKSVYQEVGDMSSKFVTEAPVDVATGKN